MKNEEKNKKEEIIHLRIGRQKGIERPEFRRQEEPVGENKLKNYREMYEFFIDYITKTKGTGQTNYSLNFIIKGKTKIQEDIYIYNEKDWTDYFKNDIIQQYYYKKKDDVSKIITCLKICYVVVDQKKAIEDQDDSIVKERNKEKIKVIFNNISSANFISKILKIITNDKSIMNSIGHILINEIISNDESKNDDKNYDEKSLESLLNEKSKTIKKELTKFTDIKNIFEESGIIEVKKEPNKRLQSLNPDFFNRFRNNEDLTINNKKFEMINEEDYNDESAKSTIIPNNIKKLLDKNSFLIEPEKKKYNDGIDSLHDKLVKEFFEIENMKKDED